LAFSELADFPFCAAFLTECPVRSFLRVFLAFPCFPVYNNGAMDTARDVFNSRMKDLQKRLTENEVYQGQINENTKAIEAFIEALEIGQEALQFLEDVANARRGEMKSKIEIVITEALQLIYGPSYRMELTYSIKNNRSWMDVEVVKRTPHGEIRRTMDGFGGGVSDTISVPLRLLVLIGSKQTDKVAVLDEAYKHVDLERIEAVADFLKEVSEKLGLQTLLFSHHEAMESRADRVFELQDVSGTTKVAKIV